jgi:hypothetical protein
VPAALAAFAAATAAAAPPPAAAPAQPFDAIVREIDPARIDGWIRTLVGFGTRNTLSDPADPQRGIGAARRWLHAEFERCGREAGGRLVVTDDAFVAPPGPRVPAPTELVNVVATLPGDQPASRARIYVVSGHYDSMNSDVRDPTRDAPGADDDASGTAAVLAAACALARHHFDATLVFMAVAGEEQGLLGAAHWAQAARARGDDVAGMFTNDIVGSSHAADGRADGGRVRLFAEGVPATATPDEALTTRVATGGENDSPARELARFVHATAAAHLPGFAVDVIWRRDRYLRGGDHIPFLEAGYPALRFTEPNEDFRHQHQDVRVADGVQYGDLPQFVDPAYVANVARVNALSLAALALAPAAPRNVLVEVVRLENDTTLRWDPNPEPDLAGYRVRWRHTTSADWEGARDVGNVTRVTLPLSKDDLLFGVEAVDREGHASVASYPRPWRGP